MSRRLRSILLASILTVAQAVTLCDRASAASPEVIKIEIDFFEDGSSAPMNRATVWTSGRRLRVEQSVPGQI